MAYYKQANLITESLLITADLIDSMMLVDETELTKRALKKGVAEIKSLTRNRQYEGWEAAVHHEFKVIRNHLNFMLLDLSKRPELGDKYYYHQEAVKKQIALIEKYAFN
ncbi:hypothetical protein [Vibrio sp. D431a]|uniref:hypothetical protein n=1 Tax=Vibrio sp. D431a TaxID=2837388 RepID=UPI00255534EF|nr:hypothetical protein [Vibrio sp. D431a]MDK9793792.1 hypothetical protein [Vibrio sp. D431a]